MAKVQIKSEKLTPFGGIFQSWSNLTPCFHLLSTRHLVRDAAVSSDVLSFRDKSAWMESLTCWKVNTPTDAFVFSFISVPAKWIMTARQYVLNIYTENRAYARPFKTGFGYSPFLMVLICVLPQVALWGKGKVCPNRTKFTLILS